MSYRHCEKIKKIPRPLGREKRKLIVYRARARALPAKSASGAVRQKGFRAAPGVTCTGQYVAFVNKNQNPQKARRVQGNNFADFGGAIYTPHSVTLREEHGLLRAGYSDQ